MNTWPKKYRHELLQIHHEIWNNSNYPGTLQLCENCGQPTEKCEEDELMIDDFGPVCSECYDDFVSSLDEA